ncbi:AAA family ATPase [Paraburkholderia sp. CNPSo 3157]|uniref:AAA family ATPase n=1 Tax=Paraburkholderia franconis TaxID=2654983 RepID=A0A7X1TH86_9BURK|nr:AAA family ATPase [Paraburkholderia franconis]MPW19272.1 AAA family ATPase [Paraburkholderia franconis]
MNITIQDIVDQAARATDIVSQVRGRMLAPNARKIPPVFNASQLAVLCEVDKSQITYRASKGDLPPGTVNATGSRREFSLPEAREWVRAYRNNALRPASAPAMTVAIGNFKGGVSKTTTAMTLAQGLSLRGHRVLVIDTDPQGSLTTLFGILPDTEVEEDSTITALATGDQSSIEYAIRETYWDGIDLVPASSSLFNVEFILPSRQMKEPDFEFWNVLNTSLEQARSNYDVIIIDTPPALSYGTVNAFMAADGLIVPTPPNALDFASSAQFWTLFSDLASNLTAETNTDKSFEFIHVLLSRVDPADAAAGVVREWISATYAEKVLPVEIPKTAVTAASSAEFGTVYDISRYDGNAKTYRRAREAYDRVTEIVEQSIVAFWAKSK